MIKILGLDHIVIRTNNMAAMLNFYCGVLGCTIERELQPAIGLVQLRAGDALIDLVLVDSELGKLGGGPPSQDGRNIDHYCLCIEKVDEDMLVSALREQNIKHSEFAERYGAQGFGRSIYIDDPEGNVVELKFAIS